MNLFLVIGIPTILVVSFVFGGLMAKKKGNIGTGKVYGFLLLAILTLALVVLVSFFQN
ncbi:MAG: hypothetical protein AAB570_02020 [Patescibacteria group bacterium]